MWDTIIKELLKLSGNKIIVIIAAMLTVMSFLDIGYNQNNLHFAIRNLPNWYLLITGFLLFLLFIIPQRLGNIAINGQREKGKNKSSHKNADWQSKFSSIGVDPLLMYGFDDKPSTTTICDVCCVHVMWADPRGNSVSVKLLEGEGNCIINFNNEFPDFPSDVTIRPSGHQPLSNSNQDGTICHSMLVIRVQNISATDAVSVGFRIVDRLGTHWFYAKGPDYYMVTNLAPGEAKDAKCNLGNTKWWMLFPPDGNSKYKADYPNFSIIPAIVIEVGGPNGNRRPGIGKGSILVKGIYLKDE
jgi:hypothetical protein